MKYKNMRTQAVIETACELQGGHWIKVEKEQPKNSAEQAQKAEENKPKKSVTAKNTANRTAASKSSAAKTNRKTTGK